MFISEIEKKYLTANKGSSTQAKMAAEEVARLHN